jgi:hypothetical protein
MFPRLRLCAVGLIAFLFLLVQPAAYGELFLFIDPTTEEIYFTGSDSGTPQVHDSFEGNTLRVFWNNGSDGGVFLTSLLLGGDMVSTEQDNIDVGFLGVIDIYDGYLVLDFERGNYLDLTDPVVFTGLETTVSYSGLSDDAKASLETILGGTVFVPDDTIIDPPGSSQSGYTLVIVGIVPEPSTGILLGAGLVAWIGRRKRPLKV